MRQSFELVGDGGKVGAMDLVLGLAYIKFLEESFKVGCELALLGL